MSAFCYFTLIHNHHQRHHHHFNHHHRRHTTFSPIFWETNITYLSTLSVPSYFNDKSRNVKYNKWMFIITAIHIDRKIHTYINHSIYIYVHVLSISKFFYYPKLNVYRGNIHTYILYIDRSLCAHLYYYRVHCLWDLQD